MRHSLGDATYARAGVCKAGGRRLYLLRPSIETLLLEERS